MEVIDTDVVFVGLGAFRSAALWRLAERAYVPGAATLASE
jgi:hypothetical protein